MENKSRVELREDLEFERKKIFRLELELKEKNNAFHKMSSTQNDLYRSLDNINKNHDRVTERENELQGSLNNEINKLRIKISALEQENLNLKTDQHFLREKTCDKEEKIKGNNEQRTKIKNH